MRKKLKILVNEARGTLTDKNRNKSALTTSPASRFLIPVKLERSTTPNNSAWKKIHKQFKADKSIKRTPTPTNRSLSNLSIGDLRTFKIKRSSKGKIQFRVSGQVDRENSAESKCFQIITTSRIKIQHRVQ